MKKCIEIEVIRAGQRRPYGDSVYEAVYTFVGGYMGEWTPTEEMVIAYVKADFGRDFYPLREGVGPAPYLKKLKRVSRNKWRVVIVEPFYD